MILADELQFLAIAEKKREKIRLDGICLPVSSWALLTTELRSHTLGVGQMFRGFFSPAEETDTICNEIKFIWSADWEPNKAMFLAGELEF